VHVVALTRDDGPGCLVELVRCSACGQSVWQLDGVDVDKSRALAALSAAFTSTAPKPRQARVRPQPPAATSTAAIAPEPVQLGALLSGWQVLGAR
jgi:hypothetical protein